MNISIAVAAHKQYPMPNDSMYLPIQVGAALHRNNLGFQTDNAGDNISDRNGHYSELTALYWLWKNSDAEYKGLAHYRRHFGTTHVFRRVFSRNRLDTIATKQDVEHLLEQTSIIVPRKRHYYIETIYSHYAHTMDARQLDDTREILSRDYPEYLPAFDRVMASRSAHLFNMFIMESRLVNDYCSFMFSVISKLEEDIGYRDLDTFQARYPGRISERLLDVWLLTKGYHYTELPVVSTERVNWWKKGTSFLCAKFVGTTYKASF
ncbi:DUF4422 domain-containing protein [Bifidobacterium sp.]|uniref:DUF4422 domain-containing protein n=1 Tax=Bifidobacterium sp. TaxID=41200 RepID=UPI0039EC9457